VWIDGWKLAFFPPSLPASDDKINKIIMMMMMMESPTTLIVLESGGDV